MNSLRRIIAYVSGKYTGQSREEIAANIRIARVTAIECLQEGFGVLCPHLNTIHMEEDAPFMSHEDWLTMDARLIEGCDAVLLLPNWQDSPGARIEKAHAEKVGVPIFTSIAAMKDYFTQGKIVGYGIPMTFELSE